jgi:hypothetical protein
MVPLGERALPGKSHTVGPFLPFFSDECNKQEVFALPYKERFTLHCERFYDDYAFLT